jgi:peptidoglycan lytic transglycosylase G
MTIRRGGGPRDRSDAGSNSKTMPAWRASDGRGGPPVVTPRYRRADERRSRGLPGPIRFLLFGGALAGLVLVALLTAFRPLISAGVVTWAWDNPGTITRWDFIAEFVRDDLGSSLTDPAGADSTQKPFDVQPADTIFTIAPRLQQDGFVVNPRAFLYVALETGLGAKLQAGTFVLRQNMTPSEVADALVRARVTMTSVNVTFREGIRLEQQTALLQTMDTGVDPKAFYDLAKHPTKDLLAANPWLEDAGLPDGASLEGFLYPATYTLITSVSGGPFHATTAEDLIQMELDKFVAAVGQERMTVPSSRGLTFFQVVTLASIVQHETANPDERAIIAGVYQNRLDKLHGVAPILNADPTVIWALDTVKLGQVDFADWQTYFFWSRPKAKLASIDVPSSLQGYQTYQTGGLIPGPISTPTVADIDAALHPNQVDGYLYFVAIPNTNTHAFAKTLEEQNRNLHKYGYI